MPPKRTLSMLLRAWRCPSCRRHLSTTHARRAVGPESPRFIEVPEPPQQTANPRPRVKGVLPVPRNVFKNTGPGKGLDRASTESIAKATQDPATRKAYPEASRQAWRQKLSEQRKLNLREGLTALRARTEKTTKTLEERGARRQRERQEALEKPVDESERLTAPSHELDLQTLLHGKLQDPTRDARLSRRRALHTHLQSLKQTSRQESLHSLYMQARSFIVNPQQLDAAVEDAFGSDENPVTFGQLTGRGSNSVWAFGRPDGVKEMLARAAKQAGSGAMQGAGGADMVSKERMRRVAEELTGGALDDERR